jgi:uncharacterized protein (TIGR04141 family)
MPKEDRDKIQIGVYRIDKSLFGSSTNLKIADQIIEQYNPKVSEEEQFREQVLGPSNFDGFEIKIFFASKIRWPKWRPFLNDIVANDSPLLKATNKDVSFIAFIGDSKNLYAISGGQGNFTVQNFIDQNFGIEIITRVISKESRVIKSLQERGVTGVVLGSTKFFRGDYGLTDEDQFGKIYKQIKAELDQKILIEDFGFNEVDIKRNAGCLAKSSFQLNKSVNFDTLLTILGKISAILEREPQFSLNKVRLISKKGKKNKDLVKFLEERLLEVLLEHCTKNTEIDFDFSHPDFDKYLVAEKYSILKTAKKEVYSADRLDNLVEILAQLRTLNLLNFDSLDRFRGSLYSLRVRSVDGDDRILTQGNFRDHLHGEITHANKTYFFIDSEWYEIQPDFVTDLNKDTKGLISEYNNPDLLEETLDITQDENLFNAKFIGKQGFIVLDKITPENIEMCDILKFSNDAIYLIHVKKGFNNSIRELASQMIISMRRVLTDIKSDYSYIDSIEASLKGKVNSRDDYFNKIANQPMPNGGLKNIFKDKKNRQIYFCFAFVDVATTPRSIERPDSFHSNIAKFSLIELQKEINKEGFGFVVTQINRT